MLSGLLVITRMGENAVKADKCCVCLLLRVLADPTERTCGRALTHKRNRQIVVYHSQHK